MGREPIKSSNAAKNPQADPPASDYPRWEEAPRPQTLTWGLCSSQLLLRAVCAVTMRGDSISFAQGRAGTWVSVTILAGAERPKYTAHSPEELDTILEALAAL